MAEEEADDAVSARAMLLRRAERSEQLSSRRPAAQSLLELVG